MASAVLAAFAAVRVGLATLMRTMTLAAVTVTLTAEGLTPACVATRLAICASFASSKSVTEPAAVKLTTTSNGKKPAATEEKGMSAQAARAPPLACTTTSRMYTGMSVYSEYPAIVALTIATPFASLVYLIGIHASVVPALK